MSHTQSPGAAARAREARQLVRSTTANLTGRQRGPDRQVRRESYDVNDRRAQVFSRVADGTRAGGLGFVDDVLFLAEEFDVVHRRPGERGPLMASGIRVLRVLLTRFLRFDTGRLDPALDTLQRHTGYTRKCVVAALARLRRHKFLDWVRRSRRTEGEAGPERKQETNAYFFALTQLPKGVLQRFRDLRERRRRRLAAAAPPSMSAAAASAPAAFADPALADAFRRLGRSIMRPSSR